LDTRRTTAQERAQFHLQQQQKQDERLHKHDMAVFQNLAALKNIIDPFSGSDTQDVEQWLDSCVRCLDLVRVEEKDRQHYLPMFLSGDAKKCEFRSAFIRVFKATDQRLKIHQQLCNRQQGPTETVQSYYISKISLCTKYNERMPADEALIYLIEGLRATIRQKLLNPKTLDDLLQQAKRAESDLIELQTTTITTTDETVSALN
ncbi:unnamed protein product, partial [Didymodactylos carnosus]